MKRTTSKCLLAVAGLIASSAYAAAPGIKSSTNSFALRAEESYISQPDGTSVYSWGYGCASGSAVTFAPEMPNSNCPTMQIPGPTLIVTEGVPFSITLTNALPAAAGNTSMLFPGLRVLGTSGGTAGVLTTEAAIGGTVTYNLVADSAGTRSYYSGTQGDLQIEMGLYGAIIVLPAAVPSSCDSGVAAQNAAAMAAHDETDFRLAHAAYNHPAACYDREYLFQFSEVDLRIHQQVQQQLEMIKACNAIPIASRPVCATTLSVETEPYHPTYYMINGRSMPDDMDPNYA
ncbi:MAG TPA: multicopper oxidase domain-containing protein, partial [Steroidobacteraceae bacterium]